MEAGHRALLQAGGWIKVVSDTHGDVGKWYRIEFTASALHGIVSFTCRPEGPKAYEDDHKAASTQPGVTPCMHAALAARRLERAGLIGLHDGLWKLFSGGGPVRHVHDFESGRCVDCGEPQDPFQGFGS